jgi:manganese/zinc/iron transport system substrate-binding protein
MSKWIGSMILFTVAFIFTGCEKKQPETEEALGSRTIEVVTTTTMITDLVENIGKGRVNVTGLMGPGVDPHLYKASEGDVSRMSSADMIFYNGLHLEGKMSEVFEQMGKRIRTYAVTDGVEESMLLSPPEFEGAHDPHLWFDVSLWMKVTEHVRDLFMEVDPENREMYRTNADGYIEELSKLEDYVKEQAQKVPEEKRVLITAHDAFNYFGKAYGFEVRGLQGISTASEAGTADVQVLAKLIVEKKIPAIFIESSVPVRYIEALQAAVRSRGFEVQIGGSLYSDALGNPDTPEGTYLGMVRHNIDTIVGSLSK